MSFDDESDKIELSLKVKWNTAEGAEDNLPKEWFEAAGAPTVEYEKFGVKVWNIRDQRKLVLYLIHARKTILCKLIDQGRKLPLFFYKKIEKRYIF
ncbi:hypothetical protein ACVNPZ_15795 [Staphylococcus aureus]